MNVRDNDDLRPATPESPPDQEASGQLFAERSRIERLSRIRQLVFGSLDGLIVPLGVVSGVAGFSASDSGPVIAGSIWTLSFFFSCSTTFSMILRANPRVFSFSRSRCVRSVLTSS